ncbi:hypothetical protein BT96DRAFT_451070 [Gymnopus androsaceus JB14]|uniref:GOLD domain-containing protein n=1 Tax=Gymnopus androsaceus JB14 TaxID=1447944 RepID=A0A6A4GQD0_9AGAR|nr:hypothetical protein BT96DRAFT_451070 [Gymnopus androsaceus JB14]
MKPSKCIRLLLAFGVGVAQVSSLHVDVPDTWIQRCPIPATITRDSDCDPESFSLSYIVDDINAEEFIATVTDTALTPQTVLFTIETPGVFHLVIEDASSSVLATSDPFTMDLAISPTCPPT